MSKGGQTITRNQAVAAASVMAWTPSAGRKAVIIGAPNIQRITISPNDPAVDGIGIVLTQGDPPVILSRDLHG